MKGNFRVIDSDGHVVEPYDMWRTYIAPEFRGREPQPEDLTYGLVIDGIPINTWGEREGHRTTEEKARRISEMMDSIERTYPGVTENGFPPERHLGDMDLDGVDVAVLYPSFGLFAIAADNIDPALSAAVCRAYNDWLADFCRTDPTRLRGVAMVPLHDVEAATSEAYRAVGDLGMRGMFVRPNPVNGRNLSDPYYDPLYAALQELKVPLAIHEGGRPRLPQVGADRFYDGQVRHICSHAMEQMVSCVGLINGGTLERFPDLEVAFLESGSGWVPFWLARMDDHFEGSVRRNMAASEAAMQMKPSDYFRRQCYVSTEPDDDMIKYVVDWLGDERIVFATDYPHPDAKFPNTVGAFLAKADISDDSKRKILWDNAERLYHLEEASVPSR